tara:strand:- start:33 stop:419 length:387 start_codon:yes stop_codon:yes gene_type:complete
MIPLLQLLPGLTLWLLVLAALEEPVEEHTVVVALIQPVLDGPLKAVAADTVGIQITAELAAVEEWADRLAALVEHPIKQPLAQALAGQEPLTAQRVRVGQATIMEVALEALEALGVMLYTLLILLLEI